MKKLLSHKLFFSSIILLSFLIKTLIKEASIADAIIFIALMAGHSFIYYLVDKTKPDPHLELKKEVEFLKNELGKHALNKVSQQKAEPIKFKF